MTARSSCRTRRPRSRVVGTPVTTPRSAASARTSARAHRGPDPHRPFLGRAVGERVEPGREPGVGALRLRPAPHRAAAGPPQHGDGRRVRRRLVPEAPLRVLATGDRDPQGRHRRQPEDRARSLVAGPAPNACAPRLPVDAQPARRRGRGGPAPVHRDEPLPVLHGLDDLDTVRDSSGAGTRSRRPNWRMPSRACWWASTSASRSKPASTSVAASGGLRCDTDCGRSALALARRHAAARN